MSGLPDDLIKIIASYSDIDTLMNLTQTCTKFFDMLQTYIFVDHEIEFFSTYKYYDISRTHKIKFDTNLTNEDLSMMPNLISLNLHNNFKVTDDGLRQLMYITDLKLIENEKITNKCIKHLNLEKLDLYDNRRITNNGIKHLSTLKHLNLGRNRLITDDCIKNCCYLPN